MAHQRTRPVPLFANLGADTETRALPGRIVTRQFGCATLEFVILRDFTAKDRDLPTACLAITGEDENGGSWAVRIPVCDYRNDLAYFRRGDRIRVRGTFSFGRGRGWELRDVTGFGITEVELLQTGRIRQRPA